MTSPYFTYQLPPEKIAQRPAGHAGARSDARLLHALRQSTGEVTVRDRKFSELPDILRDDDVVVLNNTKVLPYRFFGKNLRTGGEIEVLLLVQPQGGELAWEAVGKPLRKVHSDDVLQLSPHIRATVLGRTEDERRLKLELSVHESDATLQSLLVSEGTMPIPPYIRRGHSDEADKELYQTVYAEIPGSVAAPTAGLHFTETVFAALAERGIRVYFLTLHVGLASFTTLPEGASDTAQVPSEYFVVPEEVSSALRTQLDRGGRVIAVGTTTVRALESWAREVKQGNDCSALTETSLFITPGFQFQVVSAFITNFHQPQTTHLMMVSAYLGVSGIEAAYRHGLAHDYRFLSYGDAMFLERERQ